MGKRGPKPKGKVKIEWSPNFAYAIGLLVTDGCVVNDGRHIIFVSKDQEQLHNFQNALGISVPVSTAISGYTGKPTTRIQFSDARFHQFLISIGIMPNKTKIIGKVDVPIRYFFDFLRGHLDGDGCTYSYMDPRWRSSFMFYTAFTSASSKHLAWLADMIEKCAGLKGHISKSQKSSASQLRYAKIASSIIIKRMYYSPTVMCLSRKREKIERAFKGDT